ncbi:MAG: hypothetical protein LBC56_00775 [Oscillospiraceae bacterium]|jgi:hypothetical protein|nr:hypothetical protein [Oscillospiraceae bacterium]
MAISYIIFAAALAALVPVRIWQYSAIIDPVTGFYTQDSVSKYILMGIILIAFALIVFFTLRERTVPNFPLQNGSKGLGAAFAAASAVLLVISVLNILRETLPASGISKAIPANLLNILCAVIFLALGVKFFLGMFNDNFTRIMLLYPVLWSMVRLWKIFTGYQTVFSISEHLLDILSCMLTTIFFLSAAYVASGFAGVSRKHQKIAVVTGTSGAMISVVNAAGKLYSESSPKFGATLENTRYNSLVELFVGIIPLVFCAYICFGQDRANSQENFELLLEDGEKEQRI